MNDFRDSGGEGRLSRFHWVTSGEASGPLSIFDDPMCSNEHSIAVPSVGSMVPGWTLLVPRRRAANFALLSAVYRRNLASLRLQIKETLCSTFAGTVYEFEHGPAFHGGILGCGVDQAHLHIVPLEFNLIAKLKSVPGKLIPTENAVEDEFSCLPERCDYLYARNTDTNESVIVVPQSPQSQMIRRIIAKNIGTPDRWDYRTSSGLENAIATRSAFTKLIPLKNF